MRWDRFRQMAHRPPKTLYNGIKKSDIIGENANYKGGVGHQAKHCIAGRGVLIFFWATLKHKGLSMVRGVLFW